MLIFNHNRNCMHKSKNYLMPNYEKHGTLNLLKIVKYIFSSYLNIIKAHYIRTSFTKFRSGIFIKKFANYRTITTCPKFIILLHIYCYHAI